MRIRIPSSKSQVHRLLIASALGGGDATIKYKGESEDIIATASCIRALQNGEKELQCNESGSTLRFMLAVCGALGASATFVMKGRLAERPLAPYDDELRRHGMTITKEGNLLHVSGQLTAGDYELPGNVSSQYITGLLLALPVLEGDSTLSITGRIESSAYIDMTCEVLKLAGIEYTYGNQTYRIPGGQKYELGSELEAEGDFSNAAFWLCLGAIADGGIEVVGLKHNSSQGDRRVVDILQEFGAKVSEIEGGYRVEPGELKGITIDASGVPDLIPALSIVAACAEGRTEVINAGRLRLKESDRITSTVNMLRSLGVKSSEFGDGFRVQGSEIQGGFVDSCNDHRIAMSAGIASIVSRGTVEISDKTCVKKSYPDFWEDLNEYVSGQNN